jgi:hypothetical protein
MAANLWAKTRFDDTLMPLEGRERKEGKKIIET